jgi:hypothetical protein
MAEPDYSKFSTQDLTVEIKREEEALATYRQDLREAEQRRDDLTEALNDERLASLAERVRRRQIRIESYESTIRELTAQIGRYEQRIASRATEIRTLQDSIAAQRSRLPRLTGVDRFVTLGVIDRLDRSISALEGWQTRDTDYMRLVQDTRTTSIRILAALRTWQTREAEQLERVDELRAELAGTLTRIRSLTELIATETARLERKRAILTRARLTITVNNVEYGTTAPPPGVYTYLRDAIATVTATPKKGYVLDHWEEDGERVEPHPGLTINVLMDEDHTLQAVFALIVKQLVHAKIIIYSIVRGKPPKPYTKRFQGFYNVDAIRDASTGEIDYTAKLTEREIDACIDDFYARWNWAVLPARTSPPVWIESGEFELINEPRGADLKQLSVREDEEEIFDRRFIPPETIYTPGKAESEEMMKRLT